MIEYLHLSSLDDRVIRRAAAVLAGGGLVAFPTDTSWAIGCSIMSAAGVERLKKLKGSGRFTPTLLCDDISQWSLFTHVETSHFRLAKPLVPGPYVFIFNSLASLEKKFGMKRPTVGLRIPDQAIPLALIGALGHPLFSCTASRVMTEHGWWDNDFAEANLFECGYELEEIEGVELVLDHGESLPAQLSTVLDLSGEEPVLLRQGIGRL